MYSRHTIDQVPKMSTLPSFPIARTRIYGGFAAVMIVGLVFGGFAIATKDAASSGLAVSANDGGDAGQLVSTSATEGPAEQVSALPQGYGGGLERVVALYMERDQIVSGTLDKLGPEIRKILNAAARDAARTGNPEFANALSGARENLNLGHRHITKFVTDNDAAQFSSAALYLQMSLEAVETLAARGSGQPWHDAIKPVPEKLAAYIKASERLRNLVSGR